LQYLQEKLTFSVARLRLKPRPRREFQTLFFWNRNAGALGSQNKFP
jgi:hypothetical protein